MKFSKEELIMLEICFSMNNGDNTMRHEIMPDWLKQDHDFSKSKTEKLFKSLSKKFNQFNKQGEQA